MLNDLAQLPLQERIRLVEDIWDSIAAEQEALPLTDAQRCELERRLADYRHDGETGRPPEEVIKEIRNRL
ncbi:MAG: addiction module protein [Armatimonadetes bacterium]|nr:addiction module protein [Armatimonadota bacterium]